MKLTQNDIKKISKACHMRIDSWEDASGYNAQGVGTPNVYEIPIDVLISKVCTHIIDYWLEFT